MKPIKLLPSLLTLGAHVAANFDSFWGMSLGELASYLVDQDSDPLEQIPVKDAESSVPSSFDGNFASSMQASESQPSYILHQQRNLTPAQHYQRICMDLHEKREEIIPGYVVQYRCNTYGRHDGVQLPAESPIKCAEICHSKPGCVGSTWLGSKKCVLSGELPSGTRMDTVYMEKVEQPRNGGDPFLDICEGGRAQCWEDKKHITNQLNHCEERTLADYHNSENRSAQCDEKQRELTKQLIRCRAHVTAVKEQSEAQLVACQEKGLREEEIASLHLTQCQKQRLSDKHQASSQLVLCEELHIDHQQQAATAFNDFKTDRLKTEQALAEIHRLEQQNTAEQLSQCRKASQDSAVSLVWCEDKALKSEQGLTKELNQYQQNFWIGTPHCPQHHGKPGLGGGKIFTYWCGRHSERVHIGAETVASFTACLSLCTRSHRCNVVVWDKSSKVCSVNEKLYNGVSNPNTMPNIDNNGAWDTAVMH